MGVQGMNPLVEKPGSSQLQGRLEWDGDHGLKPVSKGGAG
jgi:acyl-CoA-binding protein